MLHQLPTKIETIGEVRAWDQAAKRHETPCGAGSMVWRKWGDGPPLILCHGGSGSWTHWCRTIPVLSQTHTVWACDLPGLGDSASPADLSHPAGAAEALNIAIRMLIPREQRPRIVAFSFGCHVSALALLALGDYIRDFLIIGTAALGTERPPMGLPKERSTMTPDERNEIHRELLAMLMFHRAERIDDLAIELQAENVTKARFRSRVHASTNTVRRCLKQIPIRLRTIWGAHDVIAFPDVTTVLGILGEHHPELEAEIIPDAGHWVMFEQADAFNQALARMLAD